MKKILGLDLGVSSIGWAVIREEDDTQELVAMGSRIVQLSVEESTSFTQGNGESVNAQRTRTRGQRRGYDRYQLRRAVLMEKLKSLGMLPDASLTGLPKLELWGLRARAVTERIELRELGRVLLHLNQKRGYKSTKSDFSSDKKTTDYVKEINNRYDRLKSAGLTIGEHLFRELSVDPFYRCKEQVYPREAYVEEFDRIMACQQQFYPQLLTDETIHNIRDEIIFYQRPLKSCKHLVSLCEFEKRSYVNAAGEKVFSGPRVAPRTSPLFQVCRLWESINHIVVKTRRNEEIEISLDQKKQILKFLNEHEKLKAGNLLEILGLTKSECRLGDQFKAGIQGNKTRFEIERALGNYPDKDRLLRFELRPGPSSVVDEETGEILPVIDASFEQEPLYRLWHVLYSIDNREQLQTVLRKQFGIDDDEVLDRLSKLDFVKAGFGNKSSKAMRRILPFLQLGLNYADSCAAAGYNHSQSETKAESEARELLDRLPAIRKNELRQPVVEKILNQMVNVVNALMAKYGRFDEIRVELARELKQSKEEREKSYKSILRNQQENERIEDRIKEYGVPTRSRIQKYKLWEETENRCIYCGQPVDVRDFLQGFGVEVEHVIPKSLYFDNGFSNKVCSCRRCNSEKGNRTAYDYMSSKGPDALQAYIDRVNELQEKGKISRKKMNNLLTSGKDIPTDFIARQLRESQYIARKARELLSMVCRQVTATSGVVTDFLRHTWGWDTVLHDLNLPRYKEAGLTEMKEVKHKQSIIKCEQIKDWSKRLDHRHHAIDALTIACTRQGYIQRLSSLNAKSKAEGDSEEGTEVMLTQNLERYIQEQPHFSVAQVREEAAQILISFKSGKKSVTPGKRYIRKNGKRVVAQDGLLVPRGALCEESVYGVIHQWEKDKKGNPEPKKYAVLKYPVGSIKRKTIDKVVDKHIREILSDRLAQYGDDPKKAFATPVYSDAEGRIPIRTVRCKVRLAVETLVPLRRDEAGNPIAWANSGNNHHVAIYRDEAGKYEEQVVTFWNAVDRRRAGLPAIITQPQAMWDSVMQRTDLSNTFLKTLPKDKWQFVFSLQQNDMFILGMNEEDYRYAIDHHDYALLNKHLYRVQKISSMYYCFRHHIETSVDDKYGEKKSEALSIEMRKLKRIQSLKALFNLNPHKVHISVLGEISEIS